MLMLIAFPWDILILLACWDSDPMVVSTNMSSMIHHQRFNLASTLRCSSAIDR